MNLRAVYALILLAVVFGVAQEAQGQTTEWKCAPTGVYDADVGFQNHRLLVKCTVGTSIDIAGVTITWIAIDLSNANRAKRFHASATAALLSGKIFHVRVKDDTSINVGGCGSACRTPTWWGIENP